MKRRIVKWVVGLGGLCLVIVLAAAVLVPRILDSQLAREQIRAFLLEKTDGDIAIENIDVAWFPRPVLIARGASVTVGDKVSGKVQSIEVYPSIPALLTGHLNISRVEVTSPAVTVHAPEWADEPFDVDEIENKIRSVLATLAAEIPRMVVTVKGGSAEISFGKRPPVVITDFNGRLMAPPGELDLQVSSRANVFDSLRVNAQITQGTLATKGRLNVERLRLRESFNAILPRPPGSFEDGSIDLDLGVTAVGVHQIKAEVAAASASLELVRGNRRTLIENSKLKTTITRDGNTVHAVIDRLDLGSQAVTATGELTSDQSTSSINLRLGRELDLAQVREWSLKNAGDIEAVRDAFRYVKAGKMAQVSLESSGGSLAEMWRMNNILVHGTLREGNVFISDLGIDLQDVNGLLVISDGNLVAQEISARIGPTHGRDGALRLGLEGRNAPFSLNMMVQTDAAALRSLLLKIVPDAGFRRELTKVRNLEGQLSGRLVLGERIDSLSAKVSVLQAAVKGSYDPIPYPITIKAGRLQYGDDKITLAGVSGAVGLSSFSGLAGALSYDTSRQIEIDSGKFSLDVEQGRNLLNRFALFQTELKDVGLAQGRVELASLSLNGPLDDPSRWDFTGTGSLGEIAVQHAKLPGAMNVSGGAFSATPGKLAVSNAKVNLLDAWVTVDGSVASPDKALLSVDASVVGSIGAQTAKWLSREIQLPQELMLRSPLRLTQGRLLWKKSGDVAFRGELNVADGPDLALDVVRGPQTLEVKELIIADGEQNTRMTLELTRDEVAVSFNGNLHQETMKRIFEVPPLDGSLIQGNIEINAFLEEPLRFTARGRLAGAKLLVPFPNGGATVDVFFLEADQAGVHVRSAELQWQNNRFSLSGNLVPASKAIRIDMDIATDRVVWEEMRALMNHDGDRSGSGIALQPIEGTIRLKTDNFTFGRFTWSPFQVRASISPEGITGEVEQANLCGIRTVGTVDASQGEIGLDVRLSVADGQMESSSLCLSENKRAVKGSYGLQAHVVGRGLPGKLLENIAGEFEFDARDGQISQSPDEDTPLEATFDYLNGIGDFDVAFPDLDKEAFPFRSIKARGTVQGEALVTDELVIESSLFTVTGRGKVDFGNDQIDGRGLVSVLRPVDRVIRRIPIIGTILGGSILGIPVRVTGSLQHPDVVYLSPADVGAELLNFSLKVLGLPLEAIRLFTPSSQKSGGK